MTIEFLLFMDRAKKVVRNFHQSKILWYVITFDVDQSVEQSDWSDSKQVGEIPHADLERIPVVELEVGVDL